MSAIPSFQTTFAVPMTCDSCTNEISNVLSGIEGIKSVNTDLSNQIVTVEGSTAPSTIVSAIQSTGRDAILRGSGAPDSAAVCILETHSNNVEDPVRGLARIVQVSSEISVFDVSVRGVSPGSYVASVRTAGNISRGPASTGSIWDGERGIIGTVEVTKGGLGTVFAAKNIQIWELIGRSMVLGAGSEGPFEEEDPDTLVGVIARSAGVWDNDKTVCSCTGKTVWEERKEQVDRGML